MSIRIIEPKRNTKTGESFHYCPLVNTLITPDICHRCQYEERFEPLPTKYRVYCNAPETNTLLQPDPGKAYDSIGKLKGLDVVNSEKHTWVEHKLDGVRAIVHCTSNGVFITTRRRDKNGAYSQFQDNVPHLRDHPTLTNIAKLGYTILDAEVMVPTLDENTLPLTMGVVGSKPERAIETQTKSGMWLVLHVFDMLYCSNNDMRESPLKHRYNALENMFTLVEHKDDLIKIVQHDTINDSSGRKKAYESAILNGYEGLVIKDPNAAYDTSHSWLKVKGYVSVDVQVTGWEYGATGGKYGYTLGALKASVLDQNGNLVEVTRVIPGDDLTRDEMYSKLKGRSELDIKNMSLILELEAQCWTPGEQPRLRHPRIIRYRPDRSEPNILTF